jgi:hypothetical protein
MINHVSEHGYGIETASQLIIFASPLDVDASNITARRAGIEHRTGGRLPKFDFIPSAGLPAYLSNETYMAPSRLPTGAGSRSGVPTPTDQVMPSCRTPLLAAAERV